MRSLWRAYGQSELANYHLGMGLQRALDLAGGPALSLLAHAGLSHSDMHMHTVEQADGPLCPLFAWLARSTGMELEQGAMPQIRADPYPDFKGVEFDGPRFMNSGPAVRLPLVRSVPARRSGPCGRCPIARPGYRLLCPGRAIRTLQYVGALSRPCRYAPAPNRSAGAAPSRDPVSEAASQARQRAFRRSRSAVPRLSGDLVQHRVAAPADGSSTPMWPNVVAI